MCLGDQAFALPFTTYCVSSDPAVLCSTASAIGDSHNHSSFTDNGTGDHTLGLTNAMASAVNYTTMTMGFPTAASYNRALTPYGSDKTTTATRYKGGLLHTAGLEDLPGNMFVINGDLA